MSRIRRKDREGASLQKYLQSPGETEKETLSETEEPTLRDIKTWLEDKMHNIGSDVKALKVDFKMQN